MIDDTMAQRMVVCGWIAAAGAGVVMLALGATVGFGGMPYFVAAAALFALAYGVYRRSRVCAVLVLLNHLLGAAAILLHAGTVQPVEVAATLVLAVLYLMGVIGTFAHHARRDVAPA
ncbi:MAG TPA: hypothetical protein VKT27_11480 [Candidatus Binataceae bacterium]|nr:hypothetical protein [Candidatus Binataceae bacterium]